MHYCLAEGLGEAAHNQYIDNRSFMAAVEWRMKELKAGRGGQYVVFSPISEDQLTKIDEYRDNHYKQLRFTYLKYQQTLIVKVGMPGPVHELVTSEFGRILWIKTIPMGLVGELKDMRGTRYEGIECSKEADSAFKPKSLRPYTTQWPTVVIESGVSEGLSQLQTDACWWLRSSSGAVKIVLIFSIIEADKKIHIEKWEMVCVRNELATRGSPDEIVMRAARTAEVDILHPVSATGSLTLEFSKVFVRQPAQDTLEGDILFTVADLQNWAAEVWSATL
ncbi:hypothetical protein HOY82DRAFT_494705 [Tuber indicum]|nr:hypothetical protein HOY82DRAFT_494705 [Tuber indicum]